MTNTKLEQIDTFTVKTRKLPLDSLRLSSSVKGTMNFEDSFSVLASTPLTALDTTKMGFFISDSISAPYSFELDSINNKVDFDFEIEPNQSYTFDFLPGAFTDFFGIQNDTLSYRLSTGSYADYGNLQINISGAVRYPLIVQLTNERGEVQREIYATEPKPFGFNNLDVGEYQLRVIFDDNGNGVWDTGNYLKKIQPEKVSYYPNKIEMRANWEQVETFTVLPD